MIFVGFEMTSVLKIAVVVENENGIELEWENSNG